MKELLERIKLIVHFTIELEIEKPVFVNKLIQNIDEGDTGTFFSPFEAFSSSKNNYKGKVAFDQFKIRRRRKFFDTNMNLATAKGAFKQVDKNVVIQTEINGFNGMLIPYYIFVPIFYLLFIIGFAFADSSPQELWYIIPFMIVHATLMLGFPYFFMRRGVSKMKYELERDLYYMIRK
ncbi:MAG TPA: hypothetical protein PLJ60_11690 [Chryseolinea sp.]|nr:hypothetical protein [Chryseolinea sp.]HPH46024.1 hypothetical protein [Chryseolinea sp.]HPM30986.1 hypothetical protein [Chryseolinea sp.]